MNDPLSNPTRIKNSLEGIENLGFSNVGKKHSIVDFFRSDLTTETQVNQEQEKREAEDFVKYREMLKNSRDQEKKRRHEIHSTNDGDYKRQRSGNAMYSDNKDKNSKLITKPVRASPSSDKKKGSMKISQSKIESDSDSSVDYIKKKETKKQNKRKKKIQKSMRKKDDQNMNSLSSLLEPYMITKENHQPDPFTKPPENIWVCPNPTLEDTGDTALTPRKNEISEKKKENLHEQQYCYVNSVGVPLNGSETRESYSTEKAFEKAISRNGLYHQDDMSYLVELMKRYFSSYTNTTQAQIEKNSFFQTFISERENDELHLHSSLPGQFDCVNEESCMGMRTSHKPLTEFLTPEDIIERSKPGSQIRRRPCVRCIRHIYAYVLLNARAENTNVPSFAHVLSVGNIVDAKGQYIAEQCLFTGSNKTMQGCLLPVPLEVDSYYTPVESGGVIYHKQTGYYKPEEVAQLIGEDF